LDTLERAVTIEMDAPPPDLRKRLDVENFLSTVRQSVPLGLRMRTQAELEASLAHILQGHSGDADLHVFGYGSLMWNPALEHTGQFRARVHGWHRCFCIRCLVGRGSLESPGLMLALDKGGACNGMLLRIPGAKVHEELARLWQREMPWGSYDARWVTAWVGSVPVRAVTFVVNRLNERYVRSLPTHETVRMINTGKGALGTCRSYFDATVEKLRELGIEDRRMEHLHAVVCSA
jgi:cation transport protein ChaC